jgi:hypothetical protein
MPEDSRPELTIESVSSVGMQTAPLTIPPGCSVSVEKMVLASGSSVSAPSAQPPETAGNHAGSAWIGSAPVQTPPETTTDHV